jgi:type I restriction enzyme S subunit
MPSEWREMPFNEAVMVNPPVTLRRGATYGFVDMDSVSPGARYVGAVEQRAFEGGGARFRHDDTLMARITPCLENGKIARFRGTSASEAAFGSTEFVVIRGRPGVTDNDFAHYLTRWDYVRGYAISQMTGSSGRQRVPTEALGALDVAVPPLPVQRSIARVLGALDDKIELNRKMNETLEQMARAIFKSWFVDFEPFRGKGMVDSPLGKIPKGWRVDTLERHVQVEKGLSYKGEGLADEGLPLHNLNSVYEGGGYKYEGLKRYTGEYRDRHIVKAGDLVVTNTEQGFEYLLIGFPAIVPHCYGDDGLFTHHLYRVRPLPGLPLTPRFLYFLLMSHDVREQIIGCTNGTTVNMLAADGLRRPAFPMPPAELVDRFDRLAAPTFDRMEQNVVQSRTLAAIRDALLPRLMSGEVTATEA